MKPKTVHIPGEPSTGCPEGLIKLVGNIHDSPVVKTGLTCTEQGEWALYVTVPAETEVPLASLEKHGFPVVYVEDSEEPQRPLHG